jgi:hypothetical protein
VKFNDEAEIITIGSRTFVTIPISHCRLHLLYWKRFGQTTTLYLIQPLELKIIHPRPFHIACLKVGRKMRDHRLANRMQPSVGTPSTWIEEIAFPLLWLARTKQKYLEFASSSFNQREQDYCRQMLAFLRDKECKSDVIPWSSSISALSNPLLPLCCSLKLKASLSWSQFGSLDYGHVPHANLLEPF